MVNKILFPSPINTGNQALPSTTSGVMVQYLRVTVDWDKMEDLTILELSLF
jgi:hypothetical protein